MAKETGEETSDGSNEAGAPSNGAWLGAIALTGFVLVATA